MQELNTPPCQWISRQGARFLNHAALIADGWVHDFNTDGFYKPVAEQYLNEH